MRSAAVPTTTAEAAPAANPLRERAAQASRRRVTAEDPYISAVVAVGMAGWILVAWALLSTGVPR